MSAGRSEWRSPLLLSPWARTGMARAGIDADAIEGTLRAAGVRLAVEGRTARGPWRVMNGTRPRRETPYRDDLAAAIRDAMEEVTSGR